MIALTLGTVLALVALGYVLAPLFTDPVASRTRDSRMTPGVSTDTSNAVATLREIEFDRATGKLSDSDYETLKASYTGVALAAMRAESREAQESGAPLAAAGSVAGGHTCRVCGPRPEPDAIYCSNCGRHLGGPCARCGATIDQPGARFCAACGEKLAA